MKKQNKTLEEGEGERELRQYGTGPRRWLPATVTVLMATVLFAAGCAQSGATPQTTDSAAGGAVRVDMVSTAFEPQTVTVQAGQSITWVNEDSASHNAVADDGTWKTEIFSKGSSVTMSFDTPGTYPYICTLHPAMTGTVIVE